MSQGAFTGRDLGREENEGTELTARIILFVTDCYFSSTQWERRENRWNSIDARNNVKYPCQWGYRAVSSALPYIGPEELNPGVSDRRMALDSSRIQPVWWVSHLQWEDTISILRAPGWGCGIRPNKQRENARCDRSTGHPLAAPIWQ